MYICICNAFTDKDVKNYLSSQDGCKTSVGKTYKACSGGESPNCCKCIKDIRDMVGAHNHRITVKRLEGDISKEITTHEPAADKTDTAEKVRKCEKT